MIVLKHVFFCFELFNDVFNVVRNRLIYLDDDDFVEFFLVAGEDGSISGEFEMSFEDAFEVAVVDDFWAVVIIEYKR